MRKKPKLKSNFKVPQKKTRKQQKLPHFIKSSKSSEKRRNDILDETLKPVMPYRDPDTVPEWEWKLLDELDFEYFDIMVKFYNSIVPDIFKVDKDFHISRMARSLGQIDKFGIDASTGDTMISFLGGKNIVTPDNIFEVVGSLENAIFTRDKFSKRAKDQGVITPFVILSAVPPLAKFYVLVEEEPSKQFLNKDELIVDFSDEHFLSLINFEPGMYELAKHNLGKEPITIKIINSSNHPDTFFYYLQLKRVMRKIDQFGVIGM